MFSENRFDAARFIAFLENWHAAPVPPSYFFSTAAVKYRFNFDYVIPILSYTCQHYVAFDFIGRKAFVEKRSRDTLYGGKTEGSPRIVVILSTYNYVVPLLKLRNRRTYIIVQYKITIENLLMVRRKIQIIRLLKSPPSPPAVLFIKSFSRFEHKYNIPS